jgi:hypothetical protein
MGSAISVARIADCSERNTIIISTLRELPLASANGKENLSGIGL